MDGGFFQVGFWIALRGVVVRFRYCDASAYIQTLFVFAAPDVVYLHCWKEIISLLICNRLSWFIRMFLRFPFQRRSSLIYWHWRNEGIKE